MAAKVQWYREAWWIQTHHQGKRKRKLVGPTKSDKRQAVKIAEKINAAIALGTFAPTNEPTKPLPCDEELRRWHSTYSPTFKPSTRIEAKGIIETHLVPFFGSKDLRSLREPDLLAFVQAKQGMGLAPKTIRNHLSVLRRVLNLLEREGLVERNPAARLGELGVITLVH